YCFVPLSTGRQQTCSGGHFDEVQSLTLFNSPAAQKQPSEFVNPIMISQLPMGSEQEASGMQVSRARILQRLQQSQGILRPILVEIHLGSHNGPSFAQPQIILGDLLGNG